MTLFELIHKVEFDFIALRKTHGRRSMTGRPPSWLPVLGGSRSISMGNIGKFSEKSKSGTP